MADGDEPGLDLEPAVADFVRRVRETSGGRLRIRLVDNWAGNTPGFEQKMFATLRRGGPTRLGRDARLRHAWSEQLPGAERAYADRQLRARASCDRKRRVRLSTLDNLGDTGLTSSPASSQADRRRRSITVRETGGLRFTITFRQRHRRVRVLGRTMNIRSRHVRTRREHGSSFEMNYYSGVRMSACVRATNVNVGRRLRYW